MFKQIIKLGDHFDFITSNITKGSVDAVITTFTSFPYFAIAKHWDVPLILINPSLISESNLLLSFLIFFLIFNISPDRDRKDGMDAFTPYVPSLMTGIPLEMGFWQRQINSVMTSVMTMFFSYGADLAFNEVNQIPSSASLLDSPSIPSLCFRSLL